MESVDAVLGQKLPVGVDDVLLARAHDLHAGLDMIGDQVDVLLGTSQVVVQRNRISVEIHEPEVTVTLEPRHLAQVGTARIVLLAIVALAEARGESPGPVKGPAVIEAAKRARIALLLPHHHGAAMRTGVEEGMDDALVVAIEDQLAT